MVAHPNEELARRGYEAFDKGDLDTLRGMFDQNVKWHIPGRNLLSGDYNGIDEVFGFFGKIFEVSQGTAKLEVHDILANDEHVTVLVSGRAERDGKQYEGRAVHVMHAKDQKVLEFWEHDADQYATDEFWS